MPTISCTQVGTLILAQNCDRHSHHHAPMSARDIPPHHFEIDKEVMGVAQRLQSRYIHTLMNVLHRNGTLSWISHTSLTSHTHTKVQAPIIPLPTRPPSRTHAACWRRAYGRPSSALYPCGGRIRDPSCSRRRRCACAGTAHRPAQTQPSHATDVHDDYSYFKNILLSHKYGTTQGVWESKHVPSEYLSKPGFQNR